MTKNSKVTIGSSRKAQPRITFGTVTVWAAGQKKSAKKKNVQKGQRALERAAKDLVKAGVRIDAPAHVPLYSVDEQHPDRLKRKLNGKVQIGVLKNGRFKVIHG